MHRVRVLTVPYAWPTGTSTVPVALQPGSCARVPASFKDRDRLADPMILYSILLFLRCFLRYNVLWYIVGINIPGQSTGNRSGSLRVPRDLEITGGNGQIGYREDEVCARGVVWKCSVELVCHLEGWSCSWSNSGPTESRCQVRLTLYLWSWWTWIHDGTGCGQAWFEYFARFTGFSRLDSFRVRGQCFCFSPLCM